MGEVRHRTCLIPRKPPARSSSGFEDGSRHDPDHHVAPEPAAFHKEPWLGREHRDRRFHGSHFGLDELGSKAIPPEPAGYSRHDDDFVPKASRTSFVEPAGQSADSRWPSAHQHREIAGCPPGAGDSQKEEAPRRHEPQCVPDGKYRSPSRDQSGGW